MNNNEPYCTVCVGKFKTERNKENKKKKNANIIIYSWFAQERTSGKAVVHLHTAANYRKKQENEGDLSLILFFATSYTNISVHCRDDRSCDMHTISCPNQL